MSDIATRTNCCYKGTRLKNSFEGAGESGGCQEVGVLKEEGEDGDCWGTGDQSDPSDILLLGDSTGISELVKLLQKC